MLKNEHRKKALEIRIDEEMEGWTVERVLRQKLGVSRGLLRRAKGAGSLLLNGQPVKTNQRVAVGEMLEVCPGEEKHSIIPQRMPLDIRYEDDGLLIVNKPAGILVHPLTNEPTGTWPMGGALFPGAGGEYSF
ncbi:hypothetical protein N752_15195 [Desulforamulus aquiferis]|nr:hypothetical protein [Desulforamulus aquiferis]RYD04188.1 hypothetical protein N752_15195 [Desulforamulus aquiferis]